MNVGTAYGAISLGALIDELEKIPPCVRMGAAGFLVNTTIVFQPWNLRPTTLRSYRGFYEDLALDFEIGEPRPISELLAECKAAIGRQFSGYKGGLYTATRETPIWASKWGTAQNLVVTGVEQIDETLYALTTRIVNDGEG